MKNTKKKAKLLDRFPLTVNVFIFDMIIQCAFIILKLFDQITWNWMAVFAPLIAYLGAFVLLGIGLFVLAAIAIIKDDEYV